jgi:hypothetical protein
MTPGSASAQRAEQTLRQVVQTQAFAQAQRNPGTGERTHSIPLPNGTTAHIHFVNNKPDQVGIRTSTYLSGNRFIAFYAIFHNINGRWTYQGGGGGIGAFSRR